MCWSLTRPKDCWNDGHTLYSTYLLNSCCLDHFQWFLDDYDSGYWNAIAAVAAAVDDDGDAPPLHESSDERDGIQLEVLVDDGGDDVPLDGKILDYGLYVDQPLMMPDWG